MKEWIRDQLKVIRRIRDLKDRNRALCALNHRLEDHYNGFIDVFEYSKALNRLPPSYNHEKWHSRMGVVRTLK